MAPRRFIIEQCLPRAVRLAAVARDYGDGIAAPQAVSRQWGEGGPPELWRREFGARLEEIKVDSVKVNPELGRAVFEMPRKEKD